MKAQAGFGVDIESEGVFHLFPAQESEAYRIAQEALNNTLEHSQAECLTVDNSVSQEYRKRCERASNIGASCSSAPETGQGTRIMIEVNE